MTIELASEFEAPYARSRLRCLLLLSRAIRANLLELYRSSEPETSPEWHEIIDLFAAAFSRKINFIEEAGEVVELCESVMRGPELRHINRRSRTALLSIHEHLRWSVDRRIDPLEYLASANADAYEWLAGVLARNEILSRWISAPLPVVVRADFNNRWHCASTSRLSGCINFVFQTGTHAVWAGLAVPTIFRHEYLSHLVPRSSLLGYVVTEGWLVSTLLAEMLGSEDQDGPVERFLALRLRREIIQNLGVDAGRTLSAEGTEAAVVRIRSQCQRFFWAMNADIINSDYSRCESRELTRLIFDLMNISDRRLEALCRDGWQGVSATARRIGAGYSAALDESVLVED